MVDLTNDVVGESGNQDCLAKRRPGEPMFIILGRDPDGANVVQMWADRREAAGEDPEHVAQVKAVAAAMREYAADPANAPSSAPPASAYTRPDSAADLREALETARFGLREMIRLADMGLEESLKEPEESGNFAAYERAKEALVKIDAALAHGDKND